MPSLKDKYKNEVIPTLKDEFSFRNVMEVPRVSKVVVNIGMGEALDNAKALDAAVNDLQLVTGQKAMVTKAKKDISNFKLRAGKPIGVKVTLRGERMWSFLDRLMNVALPRVRDFRGIPSKGFDGRGNYTLGLHEQLVFPEIEYDKIDKLRGMEITVVTTARNDEHGRRLLALLGMPFQQRGKI
ncbi:MAG: 50S ribosomal protein L5 [Chloroflexi bacterium]|nr:50S ribosomal protein L5 [Chloroflexota bacterium]MBI5053762.1 50S ribosomal protein L5 [Chloroflexota bacterium]MBI5081552.1 50S ribosomal protein L5 [Chloroflexota bacterium]MBI5350009.1 50S ribosomal protein L5 [Chloroflexota bacterium]MBI5713828.1 50S ribosomal protein L5 [Chloroflexota bacterium]